MKLINLWIKGALSALRKLQTIRVIATIEPKCNLTCEHCYWAHDITGTYASDWNGPVSLLKSINVPLFFAGRILNERGAIFLRKVIEENATSFLGIVDNGLTVLKYSEFFKHWNSVNISIDGWRQQHDRQRNRDGLFDLAIETVLNLKDHELDPVISSAISPLTIENWGKFEEFLSDNNIPMSSTLTWALPETLKRGNAVFASQEELREAFMLLVDGMPKLINLYNIEHVSILRDILANYTWTMDETEGDCLKTVLRSGTIIVYRPVSLASVAELALHWDGVFYTPPTYGKEWPKDMAGNELFVNVAKQNEKELAVWSGITPLIERR